MVRIFKGMLEFDFEGLGFDDKEDGDVTRG